MESLGKWIQDQINSSTILYSPDVNFSYVITKQAYLKFIINFSPLHNKIIKKKLLEMLL